VSQFASEEEFNVYCRDRGLKLVFDGINTILIKRLRQAHACHSVVRPAALGQGDVRHEVEGLEHRWPSSQYDLEEKVFKYTSRVAPLKLMSNRPGRELKKLREKIAEMPQRVKLARTVEPKEYTDCMGVKHLFFGWHARGHQDVMVVQSPFLRIPSDVPYIRLLYPRMFMVSQ
jgi:hypothetical protein